MDIKFIQPAGLGDIIFLEPIARKFFIEGHDVYWDTVDIYADIEDYIPYVNWNVKKENYDKEYNFQRIDMTKYDCRIMEAKYQYAGIPFETWKTFNYNRDFGKEQALINALGIDINEPYRLIHDEYATGSEFKVTITGSANIKNIWIKPIEGFSLFDWSTIIENANEIHAVVTSSIFLFERLALYKNPTLDLYARHNDPNFKEVDCLISKDWKLHNFTR